jgi:hypothetical protein
MMHEFTIIFLKQPFYINSVQIEKSLISLERNLNCMKRKLLFIGTLFFFVIAFTSCEKSCKTCKKVYYDKSGNITSQDAEADYCGVELIAIDGKTIDLGALGSAKWECR